MWNFLYQLASPRLFYEKTSRWLPWLLPVALSCLLLGLIWGLVFAPADYQQGDAFRMVYVHVPAAFLSLTLYAYMGFLALLLLVWRIKIAGLMLRASASVGMGMALLALLSGSIWGKPMWGAWWVWDARLTSELILFLLYAAVVAIGQSDDTDRSDKLIAILALVGVVDLPIIHYSVYWWNTLHQGATLSLLSKPKMAASMLYPLLCCMLGFTLYALCLILQKTRTHLLCRERRQSWVKHLVETVSW